MNINKELQVHKYIMPNSNPNPSHTLPVHYGNSFKQNLGKKHSGDASKKIQFWQVEVFL
uniref:Uncharacterized protein n=1 Tax=Rhizophora mucronata TaxID=61149 RepID=A0A2P2NKX7_RHIMU